MDDDSDDALESPASPTTAGSVIDLTNDADSDGIFGDDFDDGAAATAAGGTASSILRNPDACALTHDRVRKVARAGKAPARGDAGGAEKSRKRQVRRKKRRLRDVVDTQNNDNGAAVTDSHSDSDSDGNDWQNSNADSNCTPKGSGKRATSIRPNTTAIGDGECALTFYDSSQPNTPHRRSGRLMVVD